MFVASAIQFGAALTGNVTRVGIFDDGNGAFFQQGTATAANPFGMYIVRRSDSGGYPVDTVVGLDSWNGDGNVAGVGPVAAALDWTRIQMIFIEFAWYGAGQIRWGVFVNGEPVILHSIGFGNLSGQSLPWGRTGNLPVRYEQRNLTGISQSNDVLHYGVSVVVEGRVDDHRGFTYSYSMARATPQRTVTAGTQYPVLSVRPRIMGNSQETGTFTSGTTTTATKTGAGWTVNQWQGLYCYFTGGTGVGQMSRIVSNTTTVLTLENNILPGTALTTAADGTTTYSIGLPNRGQILPRQLFIQTSAVCVVELIVSTTAAPLVLTGSSFVALASLGSTNSYAERDVTATAIASGGEVTFAFVSPNNQLQVIDLSQFFPLYNTIRGNVPDILTVAVTGTANVGASIVGQEAMS
jgi:hypothetical protein